MNFLKWKWWDEYLNFMLQHSWSGCLISSYAYITILISGIAIFELPSTDLDSDQILQPVTFKGMSTRLKNLTGTGSQLFSVTTHHDLLVLLTFSGDWLELTSTRPFSNVTMEESAKSDITSAAISPDLGVFFLLDAGLGRTMRMELDSGNCRVFENEVSCKYLQY